MIDMFKQLKLGFSIIEKLNDEEVNEINGLLEFTEEQAIDSTINKIIDILLSEGQVRAVSIIKKKVMQDG